MKIIEKIDAQIDKVDAHLNHRLSFKTLFKEVYAHFTDKVFPHGADEIGNSLYGNSGYLPWPGSTGPKPIEAPTIGPEPTEPNNFDRHAALYGVNYHDKLTQAANRGDHADERGHTR